MKQEDLSFFDPRQEFSTMDRRLPHWSQAGVLCFITWRLADSLPVDVLRRIDAEINEIHAKSKLRRTDESRAAERRRSRWKVFRLRDKFLDAGYGECWLRQPRVSQIVIEALRYHDEQRLFLTDAVVMPNHCHFIAAFSDDAEMLRQCEDLKRFIGRSVNQHLGREGPFWQVDQFDHLIRRFSRFEYFRKYIANNPIRARLGPDEYAYFRKLLKV